MHSPLRRLRSLAIRRRRWTLALSLLFALAALWFAVWLRRAHPPTLSLAERQLVGTWGLPVAGTPTDFGLPGGPMARPLLVMELKPDGVYRAWIATTESPFPEPPHDSWGDHQLVVGRWSIIGGRLRVEDTPGAWRRPARVARDVIAARTGLLYPSRWVVNPLSLSFGFIGPNDLETTEQGKPLVWRRLSASPVHPPELTPTRPRPAEPAPLEFRALPTIRRAEPNSP